MSVEQGRHQAVGDQKILSLNLWMNAVLQALDQELDVERMFHDFRRFGLYDPEHLLPNCRHVVGVVVLNPDRSTLYGWVTELE